MDFPVFVEPGRIAWMTSARSADAFGARL